MTLAASLLFVSSLLAQELPQPVRVEEPAPPARATPRKAFRLFGTVVAIDDAGTRHAGESGRALLCHADDGLVEAEVKEGRFEAFVSSEEEVELLTVDLAGRSLVVESGEFELPWTEPIAIEGRWIAPLELRVVADDSGEELGEIELIERPVGESRALHPSLQLRDAPASPRLASPLRLARYGTYWIRAPGRAWTAYEWWEVSSRDELQLPRACSLEIDVVGLDPAQPVELRLTHEGRFGQQLVVPATAVSSRVTIDSLPRGRLHVAALLDFAGRPWADHSVARGEARSSLAPDAPARVELRLHPIPSGLAADGTVEREGFVTLPGVTDRRRFTGDGSFTWRPMRRFTWPEFEEPSDSEEEARPFDPMDDWLPMEESGGARDASSSLRTVAIRDGRFRARVPSGCWLALQSLELDGRVYERDMNDEAAWWLDSAKEPLEIAVSHGALPVGAPLDLLLHVVDAETKGELTRVRMVARPEDDVLHEHPGVIVESERVVDGAASPFHPPLPRGGLDQAVWVGAEEYVWSLVSLSSLAEEGEATVELARGADLSIALDGARPPAGSVLVIHVVEELEQCVRSDAADRDEARRVAAAWIDTLRTGTADPVMVWARPILVVLPFPDEPHLQLRGVPRALLLVSVEIGFDRECLAWTAVDTHAGGSHEVQLRVPEITIPAPVPMRGTLVVPAAWGDFEPRLLLCPSYVPFLLDDDSRELQTRSLPPDGSSTKRFEWDAGGLLPGAWEIWIGELAWSQRVELVAPGIDGVAIVLPPPADCVVHVVDATTGELVHVEHLAWWPVRSTPLAGGPLHLAGSRLPDFHFELRAPAVPVMFSIASDPYVSLEQTVNLHAGANEITLRLRLKCGLWLRFAAGEEPLQLYSWLDGLQLSRADAAAADFQISIGGDRAQLVLAEPGRYRLALPPFPGFKPVAPIDVEVKRGEFTEVAIELVKEERR